MMGAMDSRVTDPPYGASYTLIILRTVAKATMMAHSHRVRTRWWNACWLVDMLFVHPFQIKNAPVATAVACGRIIFSYDGITRIRYPG